jgi:hypothetical protein
LFFVLFVVVVNGLLLLLLMLINSGPHPQPLSKGEGWLAPKAPLLHPSPLERGRGEVCVGSALLRGLWENKGSQKHLCATKGALGK